MTAPTPRETAQRARHDALRWVPTVRALLVVFGVVLLAESVIDGYDWRGLIGAFFIGVAIGDIR